MIESAIKNDILDLIKESNSILILTHEGPDGDAIGSALAFFHGLKKLKKAVEVIIPEIPSSFLFLDGDGIIKEKSNKKYDLCIVVDCANKERIGQINNEFDNCNKSICIDHHISNTNYATLNYVEDETASCAQIIYYLFKNWKFNIDKKIGECLMTGSLTDTAGFANSNVNKETFNMAGELVDKGIDIHKIYYLALSKTSIAKYKLMKLTIDRLEMFYDGRIAFSYISSEDFQNVGAVKGEHEGLVDIGRYIEGVEVSIFVREDDGYKISLRSNGKARVNEIAKIFNGGGHKLAAGAKSNKNFEETKNILINETIKELSLQ